MDITSTALISRLKNKFDDLYLNFDDFVHILRTHKAILSGSFLLQTIKNCEYSSYDLDIYVLGDGENIQLEAQMNALYNNALNKMVIYCPSETEQLAGFDSIILNEKKNIRMPANLGIKSVIRMMKSSYNGHIYIKGVSAITKSIDGLNNAWGYSDYLNNALSYIQIVYIDSKKYNDLKDFIMDSVDFDFCRNYFDGDMVYIQRPESIFVSDYIHKISSIHELYYSSHRIDKYNKRGYHIKVDYNGELYDLIMGNVNYKNEFEKLNEYQIDNLIIINFNNVFSKNYFLRNREKIELNNIPSSVNKCIIYGYEDNIELDNMPTCLVSLHIWGFEKYSEFIAHIFKTGKKLYYADESNKRTKDFIVKILKIKISFGCKIFFNKSEIN
jgi:hypothetical protein